MSEAEILFGRAGGIGHVTLNRPKALNALTLSMVRALDAQMEAWAIDPAIHAVVVRGAGDRAFCAGGDIAALYHDRFGVGRDFFREEYIVNRNIFRFAKPWIAVLDGITMGGGVGLSVHGAVRVATEKTVLAMPECGIGLFPDVGGGHYLSRLPGGLGMYLALTGYRMKAADCLHSGTATHYVPSARVAELVDALDRATLDGDAKAYASTIVARFAADPGPVPLAQHRAAIDRHFVHDSVEAIAASLAGDASEWAQAQAKILARNSPTSMKITHRQIRDAGAMEFEAIMIMEYRISQGCMRGHDFFEGVRALIIEKDNAPHWQPARLEDVTPAMVAAHFAPVANDLEF